MLNYDDVLETVVFKPYNDGYSLLLVQCIHESYIRCVFRDDKNELHGCLLSLFDYNCDDDNEYFDINLKDKVIDYIAENKERLLSLIVRTIEKNTPA